MICRCAEKMPRDVEKYGFELSETNLTVEPQLTQLDTVNLVPVSSTGTGIPRSCRLSFCT
jgi:hypothetical protein